MASYRHQLPQLERDLFLTDGGIETTLIFHDGFSLPDFASFVLLDTPEGEAALRRYFESYGRVARALGLGLLLESATWRANSDWGARLGYTAATLADVNRRAVSQVAALREGFEASGLPLVISGCIGPRRDGYRPDDLMTEREARDYHAPQIAVFRETEADLVSALTMTNIAEAIGVTRAAQDAALPVVISFTVEIDGTLPTGPSLAESIEAVDAATAKGPAYYMVNCAHPSHFEAVLDPDAAWVNRLRGLRANASRRSHADLDEAGALDAGDPGALATDYARLRLRLPHLTVVGGCCGTDSRHVAAIGAACAARSQ
jgi:S-methylmethionine-dependent homocysteine/selenocysteine methylase